MTVRELIELLSREDLDAQVVLRDDPTDTSEVTGYVVPVAGVSAGYVNDAGAINDRAGEGYSAAVVIERG